MKIAKAIIGEAALQELLRRHRAVCADKEAHLLEAHLTDRDGERVVELTFTTDCVQEETTIRINSIRPGE